MPNLPPPSKALLRTCCLVSLVVNIIPYISVPTTNNPSKFLTSDEKRMCWGRWTLIFYGVCGASWNPGGRFGAIFCTKKIPVLNKSETHGVVFQIICLIVSRYRLCQVPWKCWVSMRLVHCVFLSKETTHSNQWTMFQGLSRLVTFLQNPCRVYTVHLYYPTYIIFVKNEATSHRQQNLGSFWR